MTTSDLISALRSDITGDLEEILLAKLEPMIQQRLYNNIFDVSEMAKYLKLSEQTIRRMANENTLPHFRLRGQIFFRQLTIDSWIEEQEQQRYKAAL